MAELKLFTKTARGASKIKSCLRGFNTTQEAVRKAYKTVKIVDKVSNLPANIISRIVSDGNWSRLVANGTDSWTEICKIISNTLGTGKEVAVVGTSNVVIKRIKIFDSYVEVKCIKDPTTKKIIAVEDALTKEVKKVIPNIIPQKGFTTFNQLKAYLGSPGTGKQWHHIVEQSQIGKRANFVAQEVNNVKNIISIPSGTKSIHSKISSYYSSKVENLTNGLTVRDWLATKTYEEQFEFGINLLKKYGQVLETKTGWVFVPF